MKKNLLTSFILFIALVARGQYQSDPSLEGIYKFSNHYFRSDPFKGEFSVFLKHLINDPDIAKKNIQKRTDTSLYFFEGFYTKYNPFSFTPKRVAIILQEAVIKYADSVKMDTVFIYELIAYANNDGKGAEDIKKEFEKTHRQNKRKFFENTYKELKDEGETTTLLHNYFLPLYWLAPVTLASGKLKEQHELFLNITLRFKVNGNRAILPAPFNSF